MPVPRSFLLWMPSPNHSSKSLHAFLLQVTHDPNLECYADRILYVSDGAFVGQAINTVQTRLDLDSYIRYLNSEADE